MTDTPRTPCDQERSNSGTVLAHLVAEIETALTAIAQEGAAIAQDEAKYDRLLEEADELQGKIEERNAAITAHQRAIGKKLLEVKSDKIVPHGSFEDWVKKTFPEPGLRQLQKYMRMVKEEEKRTTPKCPFVFNSLEHCLRVLQDEREKEQAAKARARRAAADKEEADDETIEQGSPDQAPPEGDDVDGEPDEPERSADARRQLYAAEESSEEGAPADVVRIHGPPPFNPDCVPDPTSDLVLTARAGRIECQVRHIKKDAGQCLADFESTSAYLTDSETNAKIIADCRESISSLTQIINRLGGGPAEVAA
jgi:hypothetical protein